MSVRISCLWCMKVIGQYTFPDLRATLMQGRPQVLTWRKADLGNGGVGHRMSIVCRPQPVAQGGRRYIGRGVAVAHGGGERAISHLAPLWPVGERRENSYFTSQQLDKVEARSCQLRLHSA